MPANERQDADTGREEEEPNGLRCQVDNGIQYHVPPTTRRAPQCALRTMTSNTKQVRSAPRETATTHPPPSRDKLKNIGGLSSFGVGARWCLGQSPASFWVGRPSGGCPLATRAHPSWSAQTRRATRDRPSWSSLARQRSAQVPQGLSVKGHTTTRNACLSFKRHTRQIKRTVQSPPLCLRRERRLRHSPTVVAGSSMDHRCTGTKKGTASGVRRTTGAHRATKEGKASGRSDRHCHLPSTPKGARGACEVQEEPVAELEEYEYQWRRTIDRQPAGIVDAGPPCQRRTRWLAGPASVTS